MFNGRGFESLKNKSHDGGQNDELSYSVSSMQGWRNEMEDAHCAQIKNTVDKWAFFAVFDGHGGDQCSRECSERLYKEIFDQLNRKKDQTGKRSLDSLSDEEIVGAIKSGFFQLDRRLQEANARNEQDRSGTTVVCALISPRSIYLVNCGDSRAILVRDDFIELCTYDHKPTQPKERQRIQNAGGIVALSRVNGGLATSRGLGDFEYKSVPNFKQNEQFVSCEPDVFIAKRDAARDRFIVLACDGIWDVVKNEEVMRFVDALLRESGITVSVDVLTTINDKLLDHCFEKGSKDNMTIITVYFRQENNNRRPATAKLETLAQTSRAPSRISSAKPRMF